MDFESRNNGAVLFESTARSDPLHETSFFPTPQAARGTSRHLHVYHCNKKEALVLVASGIAIVKQPDRLNLPFLALVPSDHSTAIKQPAKVKSSLERSTVN